MFLNVKEGQIVCNEPEFAKLVKEKYDLDIDWIEWWSRKEVQSGLCVWMRLWHAKGELAHRLYSVIHSNGIGYNLNAPNLFPQEITDFAENLIDDYLEVHHLQRSELHFPDAISQEYKQRGIKSQDIVIYMYDTRDTLMDYAYDRSFKDFQNLLGLEYHIHFSDVFTERVPMYTVLFESEVTYRDAVSVKEKMAADCYAILKKKDPCNMLTPEDVHIQFLLKKNLPQEQLIHYAMGK